MKRLIAILILLSSSLATGTVSLRICEQDGNTPFDDRPIMVGTRLVVYVDSNSAGPESWVGAIDLLKPVPEPVIPIGRLFGRGWEPDDYNDSHFSAAGYRAYVVDWENQDRQSFELSAAGAGMASGPWFVVDYNAVSVGDCTIKLMEYQGAQLVPIATQTFHQIANCDFNNDDNINFADFAKLASYWMRTDCGQLNNCEGTDLSLDGEVNLVDVMYFAEYWLGGESMGTDGQFADGNQQLEMESNISLQPMSSRQFISSNELLSVETEQQTTMENQIPAVYLSCNTTNPDPNEEITIYIHSNVPLFCMGLEISVMGDSDITGAMSTADCSQFGWDPTWNTDPFIDPSGWVYVSGVQWDTRDASGTVGYIKLHYYSGEVTITIDPEYSIATDANIETVPLSLEPLIVGSNF